MDANIHPDKPNIPDWIECGIKQADPCCADDHEKQRAWNRVCERVRLNTARMEPIRQQVWERCGDEARKLYSAAYLDSGDVCAPIVMEAAIRTAISREMAGPAGVSISQYKRRFKELEEINEYINSTISSLKALADVISERDRIARELDAEVFGGFDYIEILREMQHNFPYWNCAVELELNKFLDKALNTTQRGPSAAEIISSIGQSTKYEVFQKTEHDAYGQKTKNNKGEISMRLFIKEFINRLIRISERNGFTQADNGIWLKDSGVAELLCIVFDLPDGDIDGDHVEDARRSLQRT